jgi:hypothetical protein
MGKEVPVLGVHHEQKPIEKDQALIPAQGKVAIWVQVIPSTTEESSNTRLKCLEDATLEALAYAKTVDIAPFNCAFNQRLAFFGACETRRTEEEIELEKIVNQWFILGPRPLAIASSGLNPSTQKLAQITLEIGLESGLVRRQVAGIESPQSAICQESVLPATALNIPLYLLRRVLPLVLSPYGPIQVRRPRLGVTDKHSTLPEFEAGSPSAQRGIEIRPIKKQRIIGLSTTKGGLVEERPTKSSENGLYECLFEICLCVLGDSLSLLSPEKAELPNQVLGSSTKVGPLRLQAQALVKPVV